MFLTPVLSGVSFGPFPLPAPDELGVVVWTPGLAAARVGIVVWLGLYAARRWDCCLVWPRPGRVGVLADVFNACLIGREFWTVFPLPAPDELGLSFGPPVRAAARVGIVVWLGRARRQRWDCCSGLAGAPARVGVLAARDVFARLSLSGVSFGPFPLPAPVESGVWLSGPLVAPAPVELGLLSGPPGSALTRRVGVACWRPCQYYPTFL